MKGFEIPKEIKGKINNENTLRTKFMDELKASGDVKKALAEVFKTITEETRFNIGVIGEPKAGKSSLVNVLAGLSGESAAKTGRESETTKEPQEYDIGKITFVDFPAFESWSCGYEEFFKKFDFRGYDLILNTINTKGDEPLQKVYENISSKNINYIIVRSNSDEILGSPKEVEEDRKDIIQDIKETMGYKEEIYFVCCNPRCPRYREGIDDLNKKINDLAEQGLKRVTLQRIKIILDILKVEYLATLSQENKDKGLEEWKNLVNELLQQYSFTEKELEEACKENEVRLNIEKSARVQQRQDYQIQRLKEITRVTGDIPRQDEKETKKGWGSWAKSWVTDQMRNVRDYLRGSETTSNYEADQATGEYVLLPQNTREIGDVVPEVLESQQGNNPRQTNLTISDININSGGASHTKDLDT